MERCFGILCGVVVTSNCVKIRGKDGIFSCFEAVENRASFGKNLG